MTETVSHRHTCQSAVPLKTLSFSFINVLNTCIEAFTVLENKLKDQAFCHSLNDKYLVEQMKCQNGMDFVCIRHT